MPFWFALILFVASTALSMLLKPRSTVKSSGLGDFQVPTADATRVIPVVFGTVKLSGPNVTWYGDLKTQSIKKGFLIKATVGYKYFLGMQLSLCHGGVYPVTLVGIYAGTAPDDKAVPYHQTGAWSDGIGLWMDGDKLFGGDAQDGGVSGAVRFYSGAIPQGQSEYLEARVASPFPTYGGLCHAVLQQCYVGNSAYIKNLSFAVRRIPDPLGLGANANLNDDANAANIIYETLTNQLWGMGRPTTTIDSASFIAAGNTLAAEGMGLSMQIDSDTQADQFLSDVLRHIDGALYTDPCTGLWTLTLARADYDPATLLEFTPLDVVEPPDFSRTTWGETLNQVFIEYVGRANNYKVNSVKADESANFATQGEVISDTLQMHGLSNAAIAQTVAMRELRFHSYPVGILKVKLNRKAWALRIGSPFKFTWPLFGISGLVMRVTDIQYGALENGKIEVQACEDIFGVTLTGYTAPSGTGWVDPLPNVPPPPVYEFALECPYPMLMQTGAITRILAGAVRADSTCIGFDVWADTGSGYFKSGDVQVFCPSGVLSAPYSRMTGALDNTGFTLTGERDLEDLLGTDAPGCARGDCLLMFTDTGEICGFQTVTANIDGTYTLTGIVRGVYDTLPADHAAGVRVVILCDAGNLFIDDYQTSAVIDDGNDVFGE